MAGIKTERILIVKFFLAEISQALRGEYFDSLGKDLKIAQRLSQRNGL
jgi:hypothetical protein